MKKKLGVHITDLVQNVDLKIFEKEFEGKDVFDCYFIDLNTNKTTCISIEEKTAALLFEGLSQIFEEKDEDEAEENNNETEISGITGITGFPTEYSTSANLTIPIDSLKITFDNSGMDEEEDNNSLDNFFSTIKLVDNELNNFFKEGE